MNFAKLKKIFVLFFVFMLVAGIFGIEASAYDEQDYVPFGNYRLPIPVTYNAVSAENYLGQEIGQLTKPTDIFITEEDRIYIVDNGNARVISMNADRSDVKIYSNFSGETLKNPNGIYVYDNGDMLITDTDNGRIIKADQDGNLIKTFTQPTSELYDTTYAFKPLKVYVNLIGQIYLINTDDYHGFVVIDDNNEFKGYVAPTKVPFSLKNKLIEIFASKEQKEKLAQEKPPMHTNFVIDDENSLYVTTARAETAQLKKFSPVGKNIYPNTGFFGEKRSDPVLQYYGKTFTEPEFVDVAINEEGIVNILDGVTGRIYQYDSEGNVLMGFGGTGTWRGKFTSASGMAMDSKGNLYVIDAVQSTLHQFQPTDFTRTIHAALSLYYDGRYDDAVQYWQQVLVLNPNYPMAHMGMGNAYLRNDQYELAMQEFKLAYDADGYSSAFDEHQLEFVRQYFGFVLFGVIAIVLVVVLLIRYLRKRYKLSYERQSRIQWFNRRGRLRIILGCIFDPVEGFRTIRDHRKDFDYVVPLLIYFLVLVSRIVSLFVTHYPFRNYDISGINLSMEFVVLLVPLLTWVVGNYLVTTIRSGEVKMREVFSASAYCMLPYVILTIPLAVVSNIMSLSSVGIYNGVNTLMWVWIGILFFVSTMSMNSYGFIETIKIVLISLFACVFMWVVIAMIFMLGNRVVEFVQGVYDNYKMYFALQGGNA